MARNGMTQADLEERQARIRLLDQADAMVAGGASGSKVALELGVSQATLSRWRAARAAGGDDALVPGKSTGRPPAVTLTQAEALEIRRAFVVSNRNRFTGSMTAAARTLALDPRSKLLPETRAVILAERSSKHLLPVTVRRACRGAGGDAAVAEYRSRRDRALNSIYTPGLLRMVREPDGSLRRLFPGERQSWDDASINFCVVVPWPWGGDKCSDRWGVRVGRFQLLAGIDDSTDCFVGWNYVIRIRDSYRGADVVASVGHAWRTGYQPEQVMFEGGAWQSNRSLEMLRLAGVQLQDAKGRPHKKLIEGAWNRLWTPLSMYAGGQIGRKRGEMEKEGKWLEACQDGRKDPRRYFPSLETALSAIQRAIAYCNAERVESKDYGKWIPQEAHAEGLAVRPRPKLSAAIEHLVLREREPRTVRRGMVQLTALSPIGKELPYRFCSEKMVAFDGAPIWVSCDPFQAPLTAHISLRRRWRDYAAGLVLDATCPCINAAPHVLRDDASGIWHVDFSDGIAAARKAKTLANAVVRRELRGITADGERTIGESTLSAPEGVTRGLSIGPASDPLGPEPDAERIAAEAADVDIAALEKEAGILAG